MASRKHQRDPNSIIKPLRWDAGFTIVSNEFAQDHSISHFTRSVILDIVSHSQDYETNVATLMHNFECGRDKAEGVLREGQKAGYIYARRHRDDRGRMGKIIYHISTSKVHLRDFVEKMGFDDHALKNQGVEDDHHALTHQALVDQPLVPSHNYSKEGTIGKKNKNKDAEDDADALRADEPPCNLDEDVLRFAFRAIQEALSVHGRSYNRSARRDRLMLALVAKEGVPYIEAVANSIRKSKDLQILAKLQSCKLIEDEEIRTRLLDGEYAEKSADRPKSNAGTKSSKPTVYTAEFQSFWNVAPATARQKGKKPEAFQIWQQMSLEDRSDAMTVANYQDVWSWSMPDDPQFAQSVFRWLESECWVALAEDREIALLRFAREDAEYKKSIQWSSPKISEGDEVAPF